MAREVKAVASGSNLLFVDTGKDVESPKGGIVASFSSPMPPLVNLIKQATVTLTDAQIKALPTSSATIIAAQGEDRVILPIVGFMRLKADGGAYVVSQGYQHQFALNVGSLPALAGPWTNEMLESTTRYAFLHSVLIPDGNDPPLTMLTDNLDGGVANEAAILNASNGGADFTGGHAANSLTITVGYLVMNTLSGQFE